MALPRTTFRGRIFRSRAPALAASLLTLALLVPAARAQFTDFMTMDLEDLSYVRISTLGRTEHAVIDYPASATVLTGEDLARLGVTTLPEALRVIPGLQVGRIDPFNYAISIRGFNDNTVNKLLVMADGRSLHDGTFTGTNWGLHEMILGDLDRVEVLRGPGASLWGANAMNGFINIVSKSAHDTLGSHVSLAGGEGLAGLAEVRHGWRIGPRTAARVYSKVQRQEADRFTATLPGVHEWRTLLAGARVDHDAGADRRLTLIGEWRELHTSGTATQPELFPPYRSAFPETRDAEMGSISAKWIQPLPWFDGELEALASLDHLQDVRDTLNEERTTATFDLQTKLRPFPGHELLAGLTYRRTEDDLTSTGVFTFAQPRAIVTFFGGFVQDAFEIVPDRLRATIGAKLERNSYSGWEFQPSARLIWAPHPHHRFWAAYAVAARTPSRAETGIDYYAFVLPAEPPFQPLPVAINIRGDPSFSTETLSSHELGYRFVPTPRMQLELSLFYNDYHDVRSFIAGPIVPVLTPPIPHLLADLLTANGIVGHTHGGEFSARWQVSADFLAEASYSRVEHNLNDVSGTDAQLAQFSLDLYELTSPTETWRARFEWEPHAALQFDASLQHTRSIESGRIPDYTALHARIAWRPREDWVIALVGRDLLRARHREYPDAFSRDTTPNLSRSLFLRITFER